MRDRHFVDAVIKAYDVRGVVGAEFNADFIAEVGASYAYLLREEGESTLVIGHDMRTSSPELSEAFAQGVLSQGINAVLLGLTSTDELYFASGALQCAGAMFTASHNPAQYNGIKLCRAGARPVGQETGLAQIKEYLISGVPEYSGTPGTLSSRDVLGDYSRYLNSLVDLTQIRPLTIAVDAANGMGGLTVPAVFQNLPVRIEPLYFDLDGTFPNHEANPLEPKNLEDLQRFVREAKADIGLAFDGDADRCFVVDEQGNAVSPSVICAIIAKQYLEKNPGATIIHNLITSKTVPEVIAENGGHPVRTRVGHSFIKAKMAETGAVFGGEHSAHYYFSEFFNADSGILAAMHVLAELGAQDAPLSHLAQQYQRYVASGEINSTVDDQEERTDAVLQAFSDRTESVDRLDGVTVQLTGTPAWFNVRSSNTEPLLRLNVEAPTAAEVDSIVHEALSVIRADR